MTTHPRVDRRRLKVREKEVQGKDKQRFRNRKHQTTSDPTVTVLKQLIRLVKTLDDTETGLYIPSNDKDYWNFRCPYDY